MTQKNVVSVGNVQRKYKLVNTEMMIEEQNFPVGFESLLTISGTPSVDTDGYTHASIGLEFVSVSGEDNEIRVLCGVGDTVYVYPLVASNITTTGSYAITCANGVASIIDEADQFILIDFDLHGLDYIDLQGNTTIYGSTISTCFLTLTN